MTKQARYYMDEPRKLAKDVKNGDVIEFAHENPEFKRLLDTMPGERYIVGGASRDMIMTGEEPHDIDVVTNQDIGELAEYLRQRNFHISETGLDFNKRAHGVFTVNLPNGDDVDIAEFRGDVYRPDDRHPEVHRVQTIDEDLGRRESPMNAIGLRYEGDDKFTVIDLYGGIEDMKNGVLRSVGDPVERISEDPLRGMRDAGFAARFDLEIDQPTLEAIRASTKPQNGEPARMDIVAKDRLVTELMRRLGTAPADKYFEKLDETGVLEYLFPEFEEMKTIKHDRRGAHHEETGTEHTIEALSRLPPGASTRVKVATALHDIGKPATLTHEMGEEGEKTMFKEHEHEGYARARKDLENLRFSNEDIDYIGNLIEDHMTMNTITDEPQQRRPLARLALRRGEDYDYLDDLVTLSEADKGMKEPIARELIKKFRETPKGVTGGEIMEEYPEWFEDPKKRHRIGELKKQLRYIQLSQGVDKDYIMKIMDGEANQFLSPEELDTKMKAKREQEAREMQIKGVDYHEDKRELPSD